MQLKIYNNKKIIQPKINNKYGTIKQKINLNKQKI